MRCLKPLKAGYDVTGTTIVYSPKLASKELAPFEFECRKCLPCRLNIAREKAIRAVHEASMHDNNIFLTLTYDEEHLESPRLIYSHWQTFIKDLRDKLGYEPENRITTIVTGEYGDKFKRPHWHAIIFNYAPQDREYKYTSDRGDTVYRSQFLQTLWGRGEIEFGGVTLDSAGYVCRYAAKKLAHGRDQAHDYHPIHKTSSRRAIGRSWIEKFYGHTFGNGFVVLPNGSKSRIPRYYVDWVKKHHPQVYFDYIANVRPKIQKLAEEIQQKEEKEFLDALEGRVRSGSQSRPEKRSKVKETILKQKFKLLQERLKL